MANPTSSHDTHTNQKPTSNVQNTPGTVGSMAPMTMPAVGSASVEPKLFDDIDPVLLAKLYPHIPANSDLRKAAMEAGEAAKAASEKIEASQYEKPLPPEAY